MSMEDAQLRVSQAYRFSCVEERVVQVVGCLIVAFTIRLRHTRSDTRHVYTRYIPRTSCASKWVTPLFPSSSSLSLSAFNTSVAPPS